MVPNFILKLSEASTKTETDHYFLEAQPQNIGNDQGKFKPTIVDRFLIENVIFLFAFKQKS